MASREKEVIVHCQNQIKKELPAEKLLHYLRRLSRLRITIDDLRETGVGKTVNQLSRLDGQVGQYAGKIVESWKAMVETETDDRNDHSEESSEASELEIDMSHAESSPSQEEEEEEDDQVRRSSHDDEDEDAEEGNGETVNEEEHVDDESDQAEEPPIKIKVEKDLTPTNDKRRDKLLLPAQIEEKKPYQNEILNRGDKASRDNSSSSSNKTHRKDNRDEEKDRRDKSVKKSTLIPPHKIKKEITDSPEKPEKPEKDRSSRDKQCSVSSTEKDRDKEHHRHSSSKEKHEKQRHHRDEKKGGGKRDRDESSSRHHRKRDKDHHRKEERDEDRRDMKNNKQDKHESSSEKHKSSSSEKHKSSNGKNEGNSEKHKSVEKVGKKIELPVKIKEEKNGIGESTKESSSDEKYSSKRKKSETVSEDKEKTSKKLKVMTKLENQEIDSTSGLNFADVLGCLDKTTPSKIKKPTTVPSSSKAIKRNGLLESTILPPVKLVKTEPISNDSFGKHKSMISNSSVQSYESYAPPVLSNSILQPPKPSPIFHSLDIFPDEKPSRTRWEDNLLSVQEHANDYDTLSSMMSSRKDRTKVYSGNKMGFVGEMPSLFNMCIRIIQENLDSLGYTGGVPYDILKPALARASIKQLEQIEFYNPYLLESTDELWGLHCNRECRMQKPLEMESWRELYFRHQEEKQEKLKSLASKVKKSVELAQPVRKTKLAYVEPSSRGPKFSKSKAATIKNGMKTLKHREEKGGNTGGPSYSASAGGKNNANQTIEEASIVISGDSRARSAPAPSRERDAPAAMKKPKRAPLMQKTLKLIKTVYRR